MAVVGAYARIDATRTAEIRRRVQALPGVTTFDLDDSAKLGIVVEAPDLESAQDRLTQTVSAVEGVLGVWPVYSHPERLGRSANNLDNL